MDTKVVSLVDRPANGEPFVVVKSEDGGMTKTKKDAVAQADAALAAETDAPASQPGAAMALIMPAAAKAAMLMGLMAAQERIGDLVEMVQGATEAEGAEVPADPITGAIDVAMSLSKMVEPYVGAPVTEAPAPTGDGVAKADGSGWTQEYIDSLPDCAFLYVEPSAQHDNDWRTLPLSNRHFPFRDHSYRLSLPAAMKATADIGAATEPWLSAQKKTKLLLRLAGERLDEAGISLVRDVPAPPETLAEIAAVADLIVSLGQSAGAAQPAAPAPVQASAPAAAPDMAGVAKRAGEHLAAVLKMSGQETPMTMDKGAALCKAVSDCASTLSKAVADYGTPVAEEKGAPPPPPAAAPHPATPETPTAPAQKSAPAEPAAPEIPTAVQKALDDLGAKVATLTAEKAELAQRVAKAERAAPASNAAHVDPDIVPTTKSDKPKHLPLHVDLAEHFNGPNRAQR